MPRPIRLDLPGIPQHVVHRGNDRRPCFVLEGHHARYLELLEAGATETRCAVHAYVLMCNHVHVLVTPFEQGGVGRLMHTLAGQYAAYFNHSMDRTGSLWEGRYKSCLVDSGQYLLNCYRYIELNPVRAGIVADPAAYRWSSYRNNALGMEAGIVCAAPAFLALGSCAQARRSAYRQFVSRFDDDQDLDRIRRMTLLQRLYGSEAERIRLENETGLAMGVVKRGRKLHPART